MKNSIFIQCHKTILFQNVFISTLALALVSAIYPLKKTVVTKGITFSLAASWSREIFGYQNVNSPQESTPKNKAKTSTYPPSERAEVSA